MIRRTIVELPGSHDPFQDSPHPYLIRYNLSLSTLMKDLIEPHDYLDRFRVGYSTLWVMRRVALWPRGNDLIAYDDPHQSRQTDIEGRYFIYGEMQADEYCSFIDGKAVYGFSNCQEAIDHLTNHRDPAEAYLIARTIHNHYWH